MELVKNPAASSDGVETYRLEVSEHPTRRHRQALCALSLMSVVPSKESSEVVLVSRGLEGEKVIGYRGESLR
jgi:hypothetical protein